jgi:hypothetical protein
LPDRRIRLFGEGPVAVSDGPFDVGIFPRFLASELPNDSLDLFHNADSFSEMDRACAFGYLAIVERSCRRYFFHVNDEARLVYRLRDGSVSLSAPARTLIPDGRRFRQVFRRPRVFRLPEHRSFEYLFERMPQPASRDQRLAG